LASWKEKDVDGQILKERTAAVYRRRARNYDLIANLYYLLGFREWRQRLLAVRELELKPGDTVVELGCGTGLNFGLFQKQIGPGGRIIGVDLSGEMLEQAARRTARQG
jgi:ubiquinone/menaquinone biosynthesis C-methylase UbiE